MITIIEGDRRAAFEVPFSIYGRNAPYVSPMWSDFDRLLDPTRNPLVTAGRGRFQLFTAMAGGRPVGRIVASVHDASNIRHDLRRGQFGFLDCPDDLAIAGPLLDHAEAWLRARGCTESAGNFNLTAMQMVGIVTDGFEAAPYTDMMWTPPHLPGLLERSGYIRSFPMSTFEIDLGQPLAELGARHRPVLDDPAFAFLPVTRQTFRARMEDARLVLNSGFDANPMFVPVSREEFAFQAGDMMWIMDRRLSIVAHHRGKPVGVVVCVPDMNPFCRMSGSRLSWLTPWHFLRSRWRRDRAVIVFYAVARGMHGRGVMPVLLHKVVNAAAAAGYRRLGVTWIADSNHASLKQMSRLGAGRCHRLHLFSKPI